MPLPEECAYWDQVSLKHVAMEGSGGWTLADNSWKRPEQIKRMLRYDWYGEQILEIGVGNGIIGGILRTLSGNAFNYIGTELSERFINWSKHVFNLNVVNADVRELPDGPFTRIIAFDSLEHVNPEHRKQGYRRIAEVAKPGALFFLHYSYGESFHDKKFDHPFGIHDMALITDFGFVLMSYDRYTVKHPMGDVEYAFAVLERR